jgi:hypothetical protein
MAQTTGCVEASCTESTKQTFAACKRRCSGLSSRRKRKKCQKRCQATFASQTLDCGCLTVDTANSATPSPCEDPCTGQTLSETARQDAIYSILASNLISDGFIGDGEPKALLLTKDGVELKSVLITFYTHSSRIGETASLIYETEAGETSATAIVYANGTVRGIIVVDPDGDVQSTMAVSAVLEDGQAAVQAIGGCDGQDAQGCLTNALRDYRVGILQCGLALSGLPCCAAAATIPGALCCAAALATYFGCKAIVENRYKEERADCQMLGACPIGQRCVDGKCVGCVETTCPNGSCNQRGVCGPGETGTHHERPHAQHRTL